MSKIEPYTTVINTLCAILITGLAVFGAFFTNIPEELAKQYSSEVANLNEQLILLHKEKAELSDRVADSKNHVEEISKEREHLNSELQTLTETKELLKSNSKILLVNISHYTNQTRSIVVANYLLNIKNSLHDLQRQVNDAGSYLPIQAYKIKAEKIEAEIEKLRDKEKAAGGA